MSENRMNRMVLSQQQQHQLQLQLQELQQQQQQLQQQQQQQQLRQQEQLAAMQHFLQQANNYPASSMWDDTVADGNTNGNGTEHQPQYQYRPQYQLQQAPSYNGQPEPSSEQNGNNGNVHNNVLRSHGFPGSKKAPQQLTQSEQLSAAVENQHYRAAKIRKADNSSSAQQQSSMQKLGREKFPDILYRLLMDSEKEGNANIVSWTASGMAFKVHLREDFMKKILPRYLRQSRYKSFVRQLNLWGLACVNQGPDRGAYFNSKFQRGRPDLVKQIPRIKCRRTHIRRPKSAPDDLMAEIDGHRIHLVGNQNIEDIMTPPSMVQPSQSSGNPSLGQFKNYQYMEPNESPSGVHPSQHDPDFDSGQEDGKETTQDWVDALEEAFFAPDDEQNGESVSNSGNKLEATIEPQPQMRQNSGVW